MVRGTLMQSKHTLMSPRNPYAAEGHTATKQRTTLIQNTEKLTHETCFVSSTTGNNNVYDILPLYTAEKQSVLI
jgi:hypothetical protein